VGRAVGWFGVWMLLGAAFALGSISVIGVFLLPAAALLTIVVARTGRSAEGLPGIVSGLGLPLLYVAFLNRAGPDPNYCHPINHGVECTELMNPWPWFAIGAAFVLGGVVLFAYRHRNGDAPA
jgi:hypothetical protein